MKRFISTHTLRGERDKSIKLLCFVFNIFQLTRSVGSVTMTGKMKKALDYHFNSHAPWGA